MSLEMSPEYFAQKFRLVHIMRPEPQERESSRRPEGFPKLVYRQMQVPFLYVDFAEFLGIENPEARWVFAGAFDAALESLYNPKVLFDVTTENRIKFAEEAVQGLYKNIQVQTVQTLSRSAVEIAEEIFPLFGAWYSVQNRVSELPLRYRDRV